MCPLTTASSEFKTIVKIPVYLPNPVGALFLGGMGSCT